MLSGADDGRIAIWRCDGWNHLKTLPGHKAGITGLAVHPTGIVALSVSRDRHLRMWDLSKGAELISFAPQGGTTYAITAGTTVSLHSVEDGNVLASFKHSDKNILCMAHHQDQVVITGGEDKAVRVWDGRQEGAALEIASAHENRVRGLALPAAEGASTIPAHIASASSDGFIKLWDTRVADASRPFAKVDTKARLTCLTWSRADRTLPVHHSQPDSANAPNGSIATKKKKRK
eukprot:jgi/Chlat1/3907/Chrsp26S08864